MFNKGQQVIDRSTGLTRRQFNRSIGRRYRPVDRVNKSIDRQDRNKLI